MEGRKLWSEGELLVSLAKGLKHDHVRCYFAKRQNFDDAGARRDYNDDLIKIGIIVNPFDPGGIRGTGIPQRREREDHAHDDDNHHTDTLHARESMAVLSYCQVELLERGADIRVIRELLGHESVATMERYTHMSAARKRRVIQLLEGSPAEAGVMAPQVMSKVRKAPEKACKPGPVP